MFLTLISSIINKVLKSSPGSVELLMTMDKKIIELNILKENKKNYKYYITIDKYNIFIKDHIEHNAIISCKISGKLIDLINLVIKNKKNVISSDVNIEGDLNILNSINEIKNNINIDHNLLITEFTNQEISFLLSPASKILLDFIINKAKISFDDFHHFLKYESGKVISKQELEFFYQELEDFKERVDRLSAKVAILCS